jgi:hypothetical protein
VSQFHVIADEIADLVAEKNQAYGSSFAKAGTAMRLLYPDGIRPAQMDDALLIVRIWDKLQRIATDRDALGESPYRDIAGYGILGAHLHESRRPTWEKDQCGSVSASDAQTSSRTTTGSAARNAG